MADSGPDIALPTPPGSRRTLAVRVEQGGALIGLAGQGSPQNWMAFFDAAFEEQGWTCGTWQKVGEHWHVRYVQPGTGICDVQVTSSADDALRGILTVAPATLRAEK